MIRALIKKVVGMFMVLLVLAPILAFSYPAMAGPDVWGDNGTNALRDNFQNTTALGSSDFRVVVANTIRIVIGFLGIISVCIIIFGVIIMSTAGGSDDKVAKAKTFIIGGILGLVIILMSYAIATFVLDQIAAATT